MALLSDLRTFLIDAAVFTGTSGEGLEALPGRIQSNKNDEGTPTPRIFLATTSPTEIEVFYSGETALSETRFDLEVIALNTEETIAITAAVKSVLNGFNNATLGSSWVLLCKVEDHNDDYKALNADSDEGDNVAALRVLILT